MLDVVRPEYFTKCGKRQEGKTKGKERIGEERVDARGELAPRMF